MNPEAVLPSAPAPLGARCRTIAFTSGKGGVGKSNLVLNTGLVLARRGRRVALLDGDLGLANLTVLLGQTPKYDLRDVLAGDKRLDEILLRGPHGITLVPAGSGVADLARLTEEQRSDLFDQIAALEAVPLERLLDFMNADWSAYCAAYERHYLAGELDALVAGAQAFPTYCEPIIERRDPLLAQRMSGELERGGACVVIGVAHCPGVLARLRSLGYVYFPCP